MKVTNISDTHTIKALIKESLREERLNLYQLLMPHVSDDEQAEIVASLDTPDDYDEDDFIDLTNWMRHGGSI